MVLVQAWMTQLAASRRGLLCGCTRLAALMVGTAVLLLAVLEEEQVTTWSQLPLLQEPKVKAY
jgi:hypothetical protein